MNLEQYSIEASSDFMEYIFYSDGPKGTIKKVVRFTKVHFLTFTYYNLGFGDWNDNLNKIDDFVVSNNQDAERVLATVAATVIGFTYHGQVCRTPGYSGIQRNNKQQFARRRGTFI